MSYTTVLEGLHARLSTVAGLNALLDYEPTSVHEPPILYSIHISTRITRSGQLRATTYRIRHRVVLRWQDNEQAELEVAPFLDAIPQAIAADPHLGRRLVSGLAYADECESGWAEIGGVTYRVLDFYSEVTEK